MVYAQALRASVLVAISGLLIALLLPVLQTQALSSSSLLLGDPRTTETSTYTFTSSGFDTGTTIRCIELDIGTAVDGTGNVGLDLSGATLDSHTMVAGGWAENSDDATDRLRATLAGGATPSASGNIVWGSVVNGATEGVTYYGLFQTFGNVDCSTGGPVDSTVVAFTFTDGELVQLTIDPTLTFTVAAVGSGQAVNGATTTIASTAGGINHGNAVTFAAKGVSAHDLQVGTNATGGYSLYIRHTGQLTNGSDTIDNHTGTNGTPTSFPAAGTEAWGYTTQDATLAGGTANRFTNPGNLWAGFSTTNGLVADNTAAPTGTETTRVGHQVGVSSSTPAGTYQTTIIYTAASVY